MLIADPDVALGIKTGGSIIGFVTTYAWGYTGEFGATPGALSQSTKEQWEMMPGHPKWETSAGAGDQRVKRGYLVASNDPKFGFARVPQTVPPGYEFKRYIYIWGVKFRHYEHKNGGYIDQIATEAPPQPPPTVAPAAVTPPQPPATFTPEAVTPPQLPPTFSPEERRALQENFSTRLANSADAAINQGRVPPANGLGAATIPPASHPSLGDSKLAPAPQPAPAVSGASGAASSVREWLYRDSKGLGWYEPRRGDLIEESGPVDTGSIVGNYAANSWISLSNVVASAVNVGVDIVKTGSLVTNYINRYFPLEALPAETFALEAGPAAIEYAATWLSAGQRLRSSAGAGERALETLGPVLDNSLQAATSPSLPLTSTAARQISSITGARPISSLKASSQITSKSPGGSSVVASAKSAEQVAAPAVEKLVPSLHPDRASGTTAHPFEGVGKALHPEVFDIIADLQSARAGDAAAAARLATRNPHVLTGNWRGWTSLDIAGRAVGARFLYLNVSGGIRWEIRSTH